MRPEVTQELVREFLDYDAETGVLTWRARDRKWFKAAMSCKTWNSRYAGKVAGRNHHGYVGLRIFGQDYLAHRLIWLWVTSSWPEHQIDHENHVKSDNRWSNLRAATQLENSRNLPVCPSNTSGVMGVCWHQNRWVARIYIRGRGRHLGRFTDKADAIAARKAAEIKYGFHENHGRIAA